MNIGKVEKLVTNLHDKNEYVIHIRNLEQALNHGLVFKKVHRVIQFSQKAWLKLYIDIDTELRKIGKNDFGKNCFKLMNNLAFHNTMKNVRKHRDIKLITTEARRAYFMFEPNCHRTKFFCKKSISNRNNKNSNIDKPFYLGLSILDLSKNVMQEFFIYILNQNMEKEQTYVI